MKNNLDKWLFGGFSVLILGYGLWGALRGDLYLPSKNGGGLELRGRSAWLGLVSLMLILIGCALFSRLGNYPTRKEYWTRFALQICICGLGIIVLFLAAKYNPHP